VCVCDVDATHVLIRYWYIIPSGLGSVVGIATGYGLDGQGHPSF